MESLPKGFWEFWTRREGGFIVLHALSFSRVFLMISFWFSQFFPQAKTLQGLRPFKGTHRSRSPHRARPSSRGGSGRSEVPDEAPPQGLGEGRRDGGGSLGGLPHRGGRGETEPSIGWGNHRSQLQAGFAKWRQIGFG